MNDQEQAIEKLRRKYGAKKCNLVHIEGDHEGVWVVPANKRSLDIIDSDKSTNEVGTAHLVNQPLGWHGRKWGDVIKFRTQGENRPIALIKDQDDLID